jgi:hypothetical protein
MTWANWKKDERAQRKTLYVSLAFFLALLALFFPSSKGPKKQAVRPVVQRPPIAFPKTGRGRGPVVPPTTEKKEPPTVDNPPATIPPVVPPASPTPETPDTAKLITGVWRGAATQEKESCTLDLKIRPTPKKDEFDGYATVRCGPVDVFTRTSGELKKQIPRMLPVSTSLRSSSSTTDEPISFLPADDLGHGPLCRMDFLKVKPFGVVGNELNVSWGDGCRVGQMVLQRIAR